MELGEPPAQQQALTRGDHCHDLFIDAVTIDVELPEESPDEHLMAILRKLNAGYQPLVQVGV